MSAALLFVALEYAAPSACPAQAELWSKVAQAAPSLRLVDASAAARRYQVTVTSGDSGFHGELRDVSWPAPRTLEARDCGELVDALALMLALSTSPDTAVERAPVEAAEAAAPAAPPPAPPTVASPAPAPEARPALSISAEPRERPQPMPEKKSSSALVGAMVWFEATPEPLKGIVIAGEHAFAPVLVGRLEARIAFASAPDTSFMGLAPQFCGQTGFSELTFAACFGIAAGLLPVKGVESSGGQSSGWLAPLLGVRVATVLGDVVRLEVSAEAEHGLLTRSYHVKVSDEDFRTPDFSTLLSAAAGAQF